MLSESETSCARAARNGFVAVRPFTAPAYRIICLVSFLNDVIVT